METSNKFRCIGKNLISLSETMLKNDDLKKYIFYLDDNPISQPKVKENLIKTENIIFNLFNEDVLSKDKIILFINPINGDYRNQPLSSITYTIDMIVPYTNWIVGEFGGELRVMNMADLISQDIDQQSVAGIGQCEIVKHSLYKVNNNCSGMTLWIKVTSSTLKGLR